MARIRGVFVNTVDRVLQRLRTARERRRRERLVAMGMTLGDDVVLPPSTWIDVAHCYLIDIGDRVRFGPQCLILAHDAQMDEFLDVGRLGKVVIGEGAQIGPRTVILCNVEIGAGTVVEAGSVVSTSLPPNSYCAGSPARVVSSVEEYAKNTGDALAGTVSRGELWKSLNSPRERGKMVSRIREAGLVRVVPDGDRERS